MSMLERLNIRGIRNFGVDAEDEQVRIKFSFMIKFCAFLMLSQCIYRMLDMEVKIRRKCTKYHCLNICMTFDFHRKSHFQRHSR